MRILIYGAGAVGCYLGGHLALAGHEVILLGRDSLAEAMREHGLELRLRSDVRQIREISVVTSLKEAARTGPFDWIAFTMKAYDTVAAIHELQAAIDNVPPIACFQNGLGNEESLRDAFGAEKIVAAAITTPVSRPEPHVIVEERARGVAVATDSPSHAVPLACLQDTLLAVSTADDSASLKWSKLLLNMLANAVPAIVDWTPKAVYEDPRLFKIEMDALREAVAVARLRNIKLINLPGAPARLLADAARWLPRWLLRSLVAPRVARGRGDKPPSLQAALRSGSRRTEAAWLNGAVAQAARQINRLAPINHALTLLVSDIAAGRVARETHRDDPDQLVRAVSVAEGMKGRWYGE